MVEVLIAVGVLAAVSLVLMQVMKSQTQTTVKSQVDAEIAQMKTELQSLFNTPSHCNANFIGRASGTVNLTTGQAIQKCDMNIALNQFCRTSQVNTPVAQGKFTVNDAASGWSHVATTYYSQRLRVVSVQYVIDNTPPAGGSSLLVLTPVKIQVVAQDRLPRTAGQTTLKSTHEMNFYTTAVYNGANVIGCPQSPNSTLAY